jgi:hypothetical protein
VHDGTSVVRGPGPVYKTFPSARCTLTGSGALAWRATPDPGPWTADTSSCLRGSEYGDATAPLLALAPRAPLLEPRLRAYCLRIRFRKPGRQGSGRLLCARPWTGPAPACCAGLLRTAWAASARLAACHGNSSLTGAPTSCGRACAGLLLDRGHAPSFDGPVCVPG